MNEPMSLHLDDTMSIHLDNIAAIIFQKSINLLRQDRGKCLELPLSINYWRVF